MDWLSEMHMLEYPQLATLAGPAVAGLALAWLVMSLQSKSNRDVGATVADETDATRRGSARIEPRECDVTMGPHLQGTLIPSQGAVHHNASKPYPFDNSFCKGEFLFLHKPTHDRALNASGEYPYGDHFKGRKRTWEMRVNLQFKKPLTSPLLWGIELEGYVPLNATAKRCMGLTVAALKQVVGDDLYHSVGDDPRVGQAPHEKPTFMMPLWTADQFIVTPEGETPPDLTDPHFSSFGIKRADDRKGFTKEMSETKFVPGPTYTLANWAISRFLDCIQWKVEGVIPFTSLDFNQFCGCPPVNVIFYTLNDQEGETRHLQAMKNYFFRLAIWSSKKPPSAQKLQELMPRDGDLGSAKRTSRGQADRSSLLSRFGLDRGLGCCVAAREGST